MTDPKELLALADEISIAWHLRIEGGRLLDPDENDRVVTALRASAGAADRDAVIEECAKVADAHNGSYAKKANYKNLLRSSSRATLASIRDEERGEDIASEIIARNIRSLTTRSQT